MESFRKDGCLSDEGLHALIAGQLDELGRLEAAEHLAYCDKCTDRYTALLTADALSDPPRGVRRTVMGTIWVRLMQSTCGRAGHAAGKAAPEAPAGEAGQAGGLPPRRELLHPRFFCAGKPAERGRKHQVRRPLC